MVLVTDIKRIIGKGTKKEKEVTGYYMQGYLAENLLNIQNYLDKAWDCVGIVSGHGKVRIGKSTMAMQVAFFIAWLLAGGYIHFEYDGGKRIITKVDHPKKKMDFCLEENVVFSADDLQSRATELFEKYGKGQVIVYDEGRQGLESARSMENINKGMEDFFQECGFMGHVIIIVLPNFFKLHEDYAVARSLFLIDVFAKGGIERGFFNFYNEKQKELLYYFGKKRIGVTAKYMSANESFWGKFTAYWPFDEKKYDEMKTAAIKAKRSRRFDRNLMLQRDILVWMLYNESKVKREDISRRLFEIGEVNLAVGTMEHMNTKVNELILKKKDY